MLLVDNVFTPDEFMGELIKNGLALDYTEVEELLNLEKDTLKPKLNNSGKILEFKLKKK
jgi:hypothetical protein